MFFLCTLYLKKKWPSIFIFILENQGSIVYNLLDTRVGGTGRPERHNIYYSKLMSPRKTFFLCFLAQLRQNFIIILSLNLSY